MVTIGPRVDIVQDHSAFFRGDAALSHSCDTFSIKLSFYYGETLRMTDYLESLIFILWEFLPEQVRDV